MKKIGITLISSLLLIGCGSSSSNNSNDVNKTYDKSYYNSIDYSNIDKLSNMFLSRDPRFIDFKTPIELPLIKVSTKDAKFTTDNLDKVRIENGQELKIFKYNEQYFYMMNFEEQNVTIVTMSNSLEEEPILFARFNNNDIQIIPDPNSNEYKIIKYISKDVNITIPDMAIVNGTVTIDYNKTTPYAIIKDGSLGVKAFNKMIDITQNYPNIKELRLKSIEGSVHDDINMQTGLLLRKYKLNTYVIDTNSENTDIASGGVDLFCAGVERDIEDMENVKLGIHSWSDENIEGKDFPKNHKLHHDQLLYFSEMLGADKGYDFYFHTLEVAAADDIHSMSIAEIQKYNILTK